jgi:hypothetical protein
MSRSGYPSGEESAGKNGEPGKREGQMGTRTRCVYLSGNFCVFFGKIEANCPTSVGNCGEKRESP